ncbi:hypothetical protein [Paenibacillus sp. QZ-Y1]|uniref:hypothetical protein n=1 Tax=Paenibacillus sp. QZ-Y1 TaxID=3414511 RepID=UPI003F7A9143
MQQLLDEKMVQQGGSPEMMDIARTGEKAMAKILDVTPLGGGSNNKIKASAQAQHYEGER